MIKRQFMRTFVLCLIITGTVAAGLTYTNPERWFEYLYSSFIFTNTIGFSIHLLVVYFMPKISSLPTMPRLSILLVLFLIGGVIGTEIGIGIHLVFTDLRMDYPGHMRLLTFNLVLSAILGSVAVVYFTLRARVEHMAAILAEKELNEERLSRLKTEAELQALQAKINPHFLFNTLNSIASLIAENPKAAEATVEKLSELFRYSLKNAENSTVTLGEELEIVRTYLEIEKVRFGDRLDYDISCDDSLRDIKLPALLIQPLVENSIKHGIAKETKGGRIRVSARRIGETYTIVVNDSGKGFEHVNGASGFGLRSVEERLRLRYGEAASLRIGRNDYTEITITIPLA